jgi:hypothetical protein
MSAIKTNPELWHRIVERVKRENIGGTRSGQWSARKAQIAVKRYKDAGGHYKGPKSSKNSLVRWSRQRWTTASGRPSHTTGERYLPAEAFKHLTRKEIQQVNESKKRSMKRGIQYSRMPKSISRKVKP